MRKRPTTYKIVWRDILIVIRHEIAPRVICVQLARCASCGRSV